MANPQDVMETPPTTLESTQDVEKIIAALRVTPRTLDQTKSILDAMDHGRDKDPNDYTVIRGVLTAMLWIGSAAIVSALVLTFIAIMK